MEEDQSRIDPRYLYEAGVCGALSLLLLGLCLSQLWAEFALQHKQKEQQKRLRSTRRQQRFSRHFCGCSWRLGDVKWVIRRAAFLTALCSCIRSLDPSAVFGILSELWLLAIAHVIVFNLAWAGVTQVYITIDVSFRSTGRFKQPAPPLFGVVCGGLLVITGLWVVISIPINSELYEPRAEDTPWMIWVMVLEVTSMALLIYAELRLKGALAPVIWERSRTLLSRQGSHNSLLSRQSSNSSIRSPGDGRNGGRKVGRRPYHTDIPVDIPDVEDEEEEQRATSPLSGKIGPSAMAAVNSDKLTSATEKPSLVSQSSAYVHMHMSSHQVAREAAAAGDSFALVWTRIHRETFFIVGIVVLYLPVQCWMIYRQLGKNGKDSRFLPQKDHFEYFNAWSLTWVVQSLLTAVSLWYAYTPLPARTRWWYCKGARNMPCCIEENRTITTKHAYAQRHGRGFQTLPVTDAGDESGTDIDTPRSLHHVNKAGGYTIRPDTLVYSGAVIAANSSDTDPEEAEEDEEEVHTVPNKEVEISNSDRVLSHTNIVDTASAYLSTPTAAATAQEVARALRDSASTADYVLMQPPPSTQETS